MNPVAPACAAVPEGLVSWWRGDTNALDVAGINPGTPTGVTYAPGMVGQAFRLNGSAYVLVPDHPTLDLSGEFTLEFWFNYDAVTNVFRSVLGKSATSMFPAVNYLVNLNPAFRGLGLSYNDPGARGGDDYRNFGSQYESIRLWPVPKAGMFHHFAGTFRQTDTGVELRMYVDSQLVRSATIPGNLTKTLNDAPLLIGKSLVSSADPGFVGLLDEVTLYKRGLSAEEIAAIYKAGSSGKCRNMPFASFALDRTRIGRDLGANRDVLEVRGRFALTAASDGIAPLTEEVEITVGSMSWTVPAGSMVRTDEDDGYRFQALPGVASELKQVFIRDDGTFRVRVTDLVLPVVDAANPLAFGLRIGNDEGSTDIVFAERERGRSR